MAVKLSSKKVPQKALLKAQNDLCAQMVSITGRTASGRHCWPTEKKTYRILKSRRGDERQKALQVKVGKHNLKALHTTYRTNPEVFDNEPTELLSDIDRDEDNMFSWDQVILAFSASKTLPPVLARKTKDSPVLTQKTKASGPVATAGDASSEDSNSSDSSHDCIDE
ncbi:hypothetical protein BDR07DRAFT_1380324 [Suillus spraguei]|nr:hypothetical protein BDR07DRAFT_1380324 [Suillus spraguei]